MSIPTRVDISRVLPFGATGGRPGTPGTTWRATAFAPDNAIGADGDFHLNTANAQVFLRTAGVYLYIATLTGPAGSAGAPGSNGTNGSAWRNGSAVPDNAVGADGDYYLRTATGDVYQRTSGAYLIVANIKGATGASGANGTNGTNGANGQGVPTGGTAGQVLSKIDGTNFNTAWVAPSGGNEDIVLWGDALVSATGDYVDFLNIPATYRHMRVTVTGRTATSTATDLVYFDAPSTSKWLGQSQNGTTVSAFSGVASVMSMGVEVGGFTGDGASAISSIVIDIPMYASSTIKTYTAKNVQVHADGSITTRTYGGTIDQTAPIDAVFLMHGGSGGGLLEPATRATVELIGKIAA